MRFFPAIALALLAILGAACTQPGVADEPLSPRGIRPDQVFKLPTPTPTSTPDTRVTPVSFDLVLAALPTPTPTPEPELCDGLGHCWRYGAWRYADDRAYVAPTQAPAPSFAPGSVSAAGTGEQGATAARGAPYEASVIEVARFYLGEGWLPAVRIAWCESGFDQFATGGAGERGWWQVHPMHADSTYDAYGNGAAMYRLSGGGVDWSAWDGPTPGRGAAWAAGADCGINRPGWG